MMTEIERRLLRNQADIMGGIAALLSFRATDPRVMQLAQRLIDEANATKDTIPRLTKAAE